MRASLFVALITTTATGCALYFPGDDDPDPCVDYGGAAEPGVPAVGQRNPETGQCEFFGGGSVPCDPACGPCPAGEEGADLAQPSWGYCESECTGLDETTCQDTSGCRAVYIDPCPEGPCTAEPVFSECWSVDMTGPIQGACDGLGAYDCSRHDDCRAIHASSCAGDSDGFADPACLPANFLRCAGEPDVTGPGNCYDPVTCDEVPPECPPETLPGVRDGCYTGFCIPLADCEAQAACDTLDEPTCVGRADCAPGYRGSDCTCDATGCTCATFEYTGCGAL